MGKRFPLQELFYLHLSATSSFNFIGRVRGCELGKELTADERTCRIVRICRPQTIQRNLVLRLCGISAAHKKNHKASLRGERS